MGMGAMLQLKLRIGDFAKIELCFGNGKKQNVLCTVWPDSLCVLKDFEASLDGSVSFSVTSEIQIWMRCSGQLIDRFPYRECTTFVTTGQNGVKSNFYVGLPIMEGVRILHDDNMKRPPLDVGAVNPKCSVLTFGSTGIRSPIREPGQSDCRFVRTQVVEQLMNSIVLPLTLMPTCFAIRGVLLSGSPGVGKSVAARAVQYHSQAFTEIRLFEVSISRLLSEQSPARSLRRLLAKATRSASTELSAGSVVASNVSFSSHSTPSSSTKRTPVSYSPRSPLLAAVSTSASEAASPSSSACFSFLKNSGEPFPLTPRIASRESDFAGRVQTTRRPELSLILIDEIDALGDGENDTVLQAIVKKELCDWWDSWNCKIGNNDIRIPSCIIATTNRRSCVDRSVCRGGRLEKEIEVVSVRDDRLQLLKSLLLRGFDGFDSSTRPNLAELSSICNQVIDRLGGYVAADIQAVVTHVIRNYMDQQSLQNGKPLELLCLLEQAFAAIPPSCLRGATISLPKICFDDVIGYESVKSNLQRVLSFADPEKREKIIRFGLSSPGGILLFGPPGNSKTRLVLASAASYGLPVIALSSADVYSPYLGDAEAEIRKAFRLARQAAPCVLFLDELDALVTDRGFRSEGSVSSVSAEARVLATLLTEMDGVLGSGQSGVGGNCGVLVFGTTNRLDSIDAALLRKGRFHHVLFVPQPRRDDCIKLLEYFGSKAGLPPQSLERIRTQIDSKTEGSYSGADIENLCREEAMILLREKVHCKS